MPIRFFTTHLIVLGFALTFSPRLSAQLPAGYPNTIGPLGIIKGLSDSALLDVVQRQTFRWFWNFAHPVSGLARERDNTVRAEYYWDYINEAGDAPNFSKGTFGPEACAIGGSGFGILSTIVAVQRGWIGKDTALRRLVKIVDFLIKADCYHGIRLPLGNFDYGGPLFFEQYTFLGIDPNGLKDDNGIDYAEQTKNHTLINRAYCIDNPKKYKGYGADCWGLTAGDSYKGYVAHCPQDDRGVIQPTAALSSFPSTPEYSMQALKHFYYGLGRKIWGEYGFADGFSETKGWYAKTHVAIDQGPIVVMIENYRSGLIWKLFMKIPDVQNGLKKLGFQSPYIK